MKNAIIYVFSGTGNTLKVCRQYIAEFANKGIKCEIVEIKADLCNFLQPIWFDYVGFAYPVHAFNAPQIVLDFADKIQPYNNRSVALENNRATALRKDYFIINTSGEPLKLNNVSSCKLVSKLSKLGFTLVQEYHYVMPYNMIFRHSDAMCAKMWKTAGMMIPLDVNEIESGVNHRLKRIPFGGILAFIFRIEHFGMRVNGKHFRVDHGKCIKCGKCVFQCPMQNISLRGDEYVFGHDCIGCVRCSFACPTNAINIGMLNSWKVNGAYDFDNFESSPYEDNGRYCKRAYAKYFTAAEIRVCENC